MNIRERAKIRAICKYKLFEDFHLFEYLTSGKIPNKRYTKMIMRNYRKYLEVLLFHAIKD